MPRRSLSPNATRSPAPQRAALMARAETRAELANIKAGYDKSLLSPKGMIDQEELRAEIRTLMAEGGLTMDQLAFHAGISSSMVSLLLCGNRRGGLVLVIQLASRFARIRHFWARCLIRYGERIRQAGIELSR